MTTFTKKTNPNKSFPKEKELLDSKKKRNPNSKKYLVRNLKKDYPDHPRSCLHCQLFMECKKYKVNDIDGQSERGGLLIIKDHPHAQYDSKGVLRTKYDNMLKKFVDKLNYYGRINYTYAVKCYPDKEEVRARHIKMCAEFLKEDIDRIKPDIILTIGDIAKQGLKYVEEFNKETNLGESDTI